MKCDITFKQTSWHCHNNHGNQNIQNVFKSHIIMIEILQIAIYIVIELLSRAV